MNKEYMNILLQSSHTESGRGIIIHSSKWQHKGQVHPARQWVTLFTNLDLCHLSAPFLPSLMQGIRSFKSTDFIQSPLRKTLSWGLLVGQVSPGAGVQCRTIPHHRLFVPLPLPRTSSTWLSCSAQLASRRSFPGWWLFFPNAVNLFQVSGELLDPQF